MTLQFTDISGDGNQPANPDFIRARDLGGIDGSWLKASGAASYQNPDLETQEAAIVAADLPYGLYHLALEPRRPQRGPKAEADYFHGICGGRDVPICLDWEYDGWDQRDGLAFLTRIEELRNRTPWVYLNEYFSNRYGVTDTAYARYPLWLASWVKGNNPPDPPGLPVPLYAWRNAPGQPAMWQFTSQATVPGIGAVDKNLYWGTADDFRNSGKGVSASTGAIAARTYIRADGVPVTEIVWQGQAVEVLGTDYVNIGARVKNAAGAIYHRSILDGVGQAYVKE